MIRAALLILCGGLLLQGGDHDCPAYPSSKWTFNPTTLEQQARAQQSMTIRLAASIPDAKNAETVTRKNFVDEYIFNRLAAEGVQPAGLASDEEFMRRVTLDLTGRPPDVDQLLSFLADQSPNKRERLIDDLLNSEAFVNRWTYWLGELVRNTTASPNVSIQGRNALHQYLNDAVRNNIGYNQIVTDLIRASGNSRVDGPVNFVLRSYSSTDPIQDTWDDHTANISSAFLGVQFLCISCHDGAHHLEPVNTFLSQRKRRELWEQAAFVAPLVINRVLLDPFGNTMTEVSDRPGGDYYVNTRGNVGQRPARSGGPYTPVYLLTGERPVGNDYRAELARMLTSDIQFGRTIANRVWAHLMGVGIVDPVDGFDLANYQTQASHPELLDALAEDFMHNGYNLRRLIRTITTSTTYQLSVHYPGTWQESYRRLFARKLSRPLEAEEVHDSVLQVTGTQNLYFVDGLESPVSWAMQLPDTSEPRRSSDALNFMSVFGRGNRFDTARTSDSSILGSLSLMNSPFITNRISAQGSSNVERLLQMQSSDDELLERLFLQTLSRKPTAEEKQAALARRGRSRTEWAEDLQWALLNKLDFLFNY
jgi:Protein of unknown function (DUF1553)/Protein of unknown function (DUF1549)